MPRVPIYQSQQVRSAALPNAAPDINPRLIEQGAAVSRALDTVSDESGQIAMQMQEEISSTAAQDGLNKLATFRSNLLYGQDGYLNKRGKDAIIDPGTLTEAYNAELAKLRAELPNDVARAAFDRSANQDRIQLELQAMRHFTDQQTQYANDNDVAALRLAQGEAGLAWNDPGVVKKSMDKTTEVFERVAKRNGWAPDSDVYKAERAKAVSGVHASVIDGMLDQNPPRFSEAAGYLRAVQGELDATIREDLESKVFPAAEEAGVNEYSFSLFQKHPENEAAALAELKAEKISDPAYNKLHAALSQHYRDRERADSSEDNVWAKKAAEDMGDDGYVSESLIAKMPMRLRAEYRKANDATRQRAIEARGADPEYQLKQSLMLADLEIQLDSNPAAIADTNLPRLWLQNGGDPKKLGQVADLAVRAQKRVRGEDGGAKPEQIVSDQTMTANALAKFGVGKAGLPPSKWDEQDRVTFARMLEELQVESDTRFADTKRQMTPEEKRKFVEGRFVEVKFADPRGKVGQFVYGAGAVTTGTGRLATLTDEQRENVYLSMDEVPSPLWNFARMVAMTELRTAGRMDDPTEYDIGRVAWDIQSGDKPELAAAFRRNYPIPPEDEDAVTAFLKAAKKLDNPANRIDAWKRYREMRAEEAKKGR